MSTTTASPVIMAKLLSRHEVAERTTAFRFERPSNWAFKSGQYLDMTLLDPSEMEAEGNVRSFSIASAPHEDTLMVATRMRDTAFKRVLNTMPLSSAVKIEGPSGSLTLHNNVKRTAVFLGAGSASHRSAALCSVRRERSFLTESSFSTRTAGRRTLRFSMSCRL